MGGVLASEKTPACIEGNSFSLSGVCDDRGQLPREGAGY